MYEFAAMSALSPKSQRAAGEDVGAIRVTLVLALSVFTERDEKTREAPRSGVNAD